MFMFFFTVFQMEQSAFILQADYRGRMMKYKICNGTKKKTRLTDNLLAMMGTNVREQEMLGLQVQRSDTPIYSHIERCTYVDCYHKICYLHRPWPFGHAVGRV